LPITNYNSSLRVVRLRGEGHDLSSAGGFRPGLRASRMLAVCAIVLAGAAGLTCAFALGPGAASAALADEPTTTSTPPTTTEPAPDPAPPRKPKPKPKPAPARPPAPTSHRSTPVSPTPVVRPSSSTPRPRAHPKAKKVQRTVHVKPKAAVPKIKVSKALGAIAGVRNATEVKGGGSVDVSSLLIVMGLALAIACFAMAIIPATYVPWRPAAIFVSERVVDLTLLGLVLFLAAGFTFFLTRGP